MTDSITAIIADDESPLRDYLIRQLAELWPDLKIAGEAENGFEAISIIENLSPDIAFLDIKMPAMSGLEVAQKIQHKCQIVFITAYDQFAVDAFNSAAIDYVLKPVEPDRLKKTIERLQTQVPNKSVDISCLLKKLSDLNTSTTPWLQWIKAPDKDEIHLLPINEVDYLQSSDKYTSVYCNGKEYLIRTALSKLEEQLDPQAFWRIHRSTIVRVNAIKKVRKDLRGRYFIVLDNYQRQLSISRSYLQRFKE